MHVTITTAPWLYSPCRTLASFTTIFQSSLLCARKLQFVIPSSSGPPSRRPSTLTLVFLHITIITSFFPCSRYAPFFCNRFLQICMHVYPYLTLHALFYWLLLSSVYLRIILLWYFLFVFLPFVSLCIDLIIQYVVMEVLKLNTHTVPHPCTCCLITRTLVWSGLVCLCTGLSDIRLRDVMQSFFSYYLLPQYFAICHC